MMKKRRAPFSLREDMCKIRCLIGNDAFPEGKVFLALRKRIVREKTGKEDVFGLGVDAFTVNGNKVCVLFEDYIDKAQRFVIVGEGEYEEDELVEYPKGMDVEKHIISRDEIPKMWIYEEEWNAFFSRDWIQGKESERN